MVSLLAVNTEKLHSCNSDQSWTSSHLHCLLAAPARSGASSVASGMGCRIPCLKAKGCHEVRDAAWSKQAWVEIVNIATYKWQAKIHYQIARTMQFQTLQIPYFETVVKHVKHDNLFGHKNPASHLVLFRHLGSPTPARELNKRRRQRTSPDSWSRKGRVRKVCCSQQESAGKSHDTSNCSKGWGKIGFCWWYS